MKNMNRINRYLLFLLLTATAFIACRKDPPAPTPQPADSTAQQIEEHLLVAITDSATYEPEDLVPAICDDPMFKYIDYVGGAAATPIKGLFRIAGTSRIPKMDSLFDARVGRAADGSRQWQINTYSFTYNSTSAAGEPVVLSARITFPTTTNGTVHQLSTLSLFAHQMLYSNTWAPSNSLSTLDARALYNSAVISPDFQGVGIDYGVHYSAFISYGALAQQMTDCAKAALEVMQQHGVSLAPDGHSTLWGCSECGPAALAFQRYYEESATSTFRNALRLTSSFAIASPLCIPRNVRYYDLHPDEDGLAYILIPQLIALTPAQLHGYNYSDFMPQWMNTPYPTKNGDLSYIASLNLLLPFPKENLPEGFNAISMNQYVAPDMLGEDGHFDYTNEKMNTWLQIVEEQTSLDGFHPRIETYIAHNPDDEYFDFEFIRDAYNGMRQAPDGLHENIHFFEVPMVSSLARMLGTYHTASATLSLFYMACAPEPADMGKFYTLAD